MLNKENTRKAQEIAEALRPLFAKAYELGKKYDETRQQLAKAEQAAQSFHDRHEGRDWAYLPPYGNQTKEQREKVRALGLKEWGEGLELKYKEAEEKRNKHQAARINFVNYLNYFADRVCDLLRPNWRAFYDRQGFRTVADIINQANPRKDHSAGACSVAITPESGTIYTDDPQAVGQCLRVSVLVCTGWACGCCGERSRYFQINPAEIWHDAKEPQQMTAKQYKANTAKIAQKVASIEKARDDLAGFARSVGLLGFVDIVGTIQKTK